MHEILVDDGPVFNDHLKVIRQVAWRLHSTSGHDLEDLFSEGCLQYLLHRHTFKSTKNTKTTTYIWCIVKNSLLNYLKHQPDLVLTETSDYLESLARDFLGNNRENRTVRDKFLDNTF